ncbi:MAG: LysR substrate-binding domain-containing protein [Adlercreutzia sp.]
MAHDDVLLHERIEEVAHGATVKLRIGMTLTAGEYVVARPLARCLGARPDIQITVRSGGTQHLMELLDAGTIDCAFVEGLFDKARYASRPFSSERLVPICAAEHRFPRTPRTLEDLLGERLILREEGSGSRNVLVHALAQRNLSPASFADHFVVESLDIIKIFVQADLGISFVYEAAVQREVQEGTLRVIPLSDAGIFHDISFIYLRDSIYEQDMEDLSALKVDLHPPIKGVRIVAKRLRQSQSLAMRLRAKRTSGCCSRRSRLQQRRGRCLYDEVADQRGRLVLEPNAGSTQLHMVPSASQGDGHVVSGRRRRARTPTPSSKYNSSCRRS